MAVLIGRVKQVPTLLMSIEILEVYICVCVCRQKIRGTYYAYAQYFIARQCKFS